MKKKLLVFALTMSMGLSLVGCGKSPAVLNPVEGDSGAEVTQDIESPVEQPEIEQDVEAVSPHQQDDNSQTPFALHGKLSVQGTQLVDANGQAFQIKGVSTHGIGWFPQYVNDDGFRTMRDEWGVNCVRLAMYSDEGEGYCNVDSNKKQMLKDLVQKGVDAADSLGMYVIVDWHILSDKDPNTHKTDAMGFFKEMSAKYSNKDNIIYEICNEPNSGTSWEQVQLYAQEVIPVIRANDPDAIIIVGTPNWCQDVDVAAKNPLSGVDNVMYAIHFYADTHRDDIRQKMTTALDAGLPIFCSEFGICSADGNGNNNIQEGNTWLDLLNAKGISYCIWNLSNKNEASSLIKSDCNMVSGWSADNLSEAGSWYVQRLGGQATGNSSSDGQAQSTEQVSGANSGADVVGQTVEGFNEKRKIKVEAKCSNTWADNDFVYYQYEIQLSNYDTSVANDWKITMEFDRAVSVDQKCNCETNPNGNKLVITPDYNNSNYTVNIAPGENTVGGIVVTVKFPK